MVMMTTTPRELRQELARFKEILEEDGEHSRLEAAAVKLIETMEIELCIEGLL